MGLVHHVQDIHHPDLLDAGLGRFTLDRFFENFTHCEDR